MNRDDFGRYLKHCTDINELKRLSDDFRDVLIEMMPFFMNTEKGIRKKERLKRRFMELISERHGG